MERVRGGFALFAPLACLLGFVTPAVSARDLTLATPAPPALAEAPQSTRVEAPAAASPNRTLESFSESFSESFLESFSESFLESLSEVSGGASERGRFVADDGEQGEGEDEGDADPAGGMRRFMERLRPPSKYQRSHHDIKNAFRDISRAASKSTVQLFADDKPIALGAIVDSAGLILTKSSEFATAVKIECHLEDGRKYPARSIGSVDEADLMMLKIDADSLPVVQWADAKAPLVGSWVVTPGIGELPEAIGVVSAAARSIAAPRAILGLVLSQSDSGAKVEQVMPGSGAEDAEVAIGDVVTHLDGDVIEDRETLINRVKVMQPGDEVRLRVVRNGITKELKVELKDYQSMVNGDRIDFQRKLGGPLSRRRAGFSSVLQHDSVLFPSLCGGPLVNLDGKAVGINIARASREASFSVPVAIAQAAIAELKAMAESPGGERARQLVVQLSRLLQTEQKWNDKIDTYNLERAKLEATIAKSEADAAAKEAVEQARRSLMTIDQLRSRAESELKQVVADIAKLKEEQASFVTKK